MTDADYLLYGRIAIKMFDACMSEEEAIWQSENELSPRQRSFIPDAAVIQQRDGIEAKTK